MSDQNQNHRPDQNHRPEDDSLKEKGAPEDRGDLIGRDPAREAAVGGAVECGAVSGTATGERTAAAEAPVPATGRKAPPRLRPSVSTGVISMVSAIMALRSSRDDDDGGAPEAPVTHEPIPAPPAHYSVPGPYHDRDDHHDHDHPFRLARRRRRRR